MPHFECLACKTRLRATAGEAESLGDLSRGVRLCLEPAGDLRESAVARNLDTRRQIARRHIGVGVLSRRRDNRSARVQA